MFIDITKENVLNLCSKDELISYAEKGLLVCGGVDLSGFVEKILEDSYTDDQVEALREQAYYEGYDVGRKEGYDEGYQEAEDNYC